MKKENYINCKWAVNSLAFALFFLLSYSASSQCSLACNNSVQVSLDDDCEVTITPDMVLEGQGTMGCNYTVEVTDLNDVVIPGSPVVTGAYIGQTLKARVIESGNSCWGLLTIEDKLPPVIDCPTDATLQCYQINDPAPTVFANDNCDNVIVASILADVITDLECTDPFSASRQITYGAVDASGNVAVNCIYTIYYERITIGDLTLPQSWDGTPGNLPHIECGTSYPTIPDGPYAGNPAPSHTGAPEDPSGSSIFPNNSYCELNATFSDQVIPICEKSEKIIRYWTILDWCTGEVFEHVQIIKIADTQPPVVTCPPDFDLNPISTDPYTCTVDWDVVPPIIITDCTETTWSVGYIFNVGSPNPPPNAIFIDDEVTGSYPNFTINNMPLGINWVRYTVIDACGNITACETEVYVVDEIAPVPVCDQFTVVTLSNNGWAHIYAESFDDGSHDNCSDITFGARRMSSACGGPAGSPVFNAGGNVYYDLVNFCCSDAAGSQMVEMIVIDEYGNYNTCMVEVLVEDKEDPYITCGATKFVDCGSPVVFDDPQYGDNCGTPSITSSDTDNRDNCGVGFVSRTWVVTDAGGKNSSCSQTIFFQNQTPFNGNINWPSDQLNLTGCIGANTDPSVLGEPIYNGDGCSLLAHTYTDQVFSFVDNACFKILRSWTVIDWCNYDGNGNGIWYDDQIIKVNDNTNPVLTCNTAILDITDGCSVTAPVSVSADDNCGNLEYFYQVVGGSSGTGNTVTNNWTEGQHTIVWTVRDMCGNEATCNQTVIANDEKAPTPYCLGNITTVLMPTTMEIEIWANDYDLGSFDNCSDVTLSFSSNINDTSMAFDCSHLGINLIQIWVTDEAGNQDYCETTIIIQDNNNVCGNMSRIAGHINNEMNDALESVEVMLDKMDQNDQVYFSTDADGFYDFANVPLNQEYEVSATKDDDYMNGVSTLDLVLIQKHILNIEPINTAYKMIAADVNNSGSVSAVDLVELRKLILGIYSELPNNGSWRFLNATQTFADESHPWPFVEVITVDQLTDDIMDNDFVAVKIGDVNNSSEGNLQTTAVSNRSNGTLDLVATTTQEPASDIVTVDVTATNFADIIGWQATLAYDQNNFDYAGVEAGALDVNDANFNTQNAGTISVSWNAIEGTIVDESEVLFTLNFRAKTNDYNQSLLQLNSTITKAEAYTTDLELMEVSMRDANQEISEELEVFQNTPNPFNDYTTISFNLGTDASVTLSIFDLNGRVIMETTNNYEKGLNSVNISKEDFNYSGVMYYRIDAGSNTVTKKMISL